MISMLLPGFLSKLLRTTIILTVSTSPSRDTAHTVKEKFGKKLYDALLK